MGTLLDDPALPSKERRDRARASLEQALERDAESTVALYWLARLEQKQRRPCCGSSQRSRSLSSAARQTLAAASCPHQETG